jgi:hypothetical protein
MVAGLVNTPNQSAGEIVREIVDVAAALLRGAGGFVQASSRL